MGDHTRIIGKRPAAQRGMFSTENRQTTCILALDDEPGFLEFLKEALECHGYRVHTAYSPKDAIRFYEERWRDIGMVFLDFLLPGMSGDAVFDEFQRINPDVRVVLLTGCQSSVADPLIKKGLRGYLPKPFSLPDLAQMVRDAISTPAVVSAASLVPS
jgi:DNA-binding NtrC family response regulator